ncbi:MAG: AMP-binding protein, partial [Moorea sp. SIO2I5]|nr:AMP-binding protein [Moorena sp. SIO2I5]
MGVPIKTVLLTAYLKVLSLFCNQTDMVTGLIVNGRPEEEDGEKLLGLFLNTVPIRQQFTAEATWQSLIAQVFQTEQSLFAHRRYPLAEIQQSFGSQLFESLFNFTHFHVYQSLAGSDQVEILDLHWFEQTNFTLSCNASLALDTGKVNLYLVGDAGVLTQAQLTHLGGYYRQVLVSMTQCSEAIHSQVNLLTLADQQLLNGWNYPVTPDLDAKLRDLTSQDFKIQELTIVAQFEQQVDRTPKNIAVAFQDQCLTYAELNAKANQVAHYLLSLETEDGQRLVRPDVLVAICVERSLEMVVGLLGILKAGAAYVPIDPAYPADRMAFLLMDSAAPVLLSQTAIQERLPEFDQQSQSLCQ